MDKIYIKNLEIYGYHGVNEGEKEIGQKFLISLELSIDLKEAGTKDNLTKTVDYGELCNSLAIEFNKEKYDLIEKCAQNAAEFVLINYKKVQKVKVTIKKPWAPIGKSLDYAAVEIERGWHKVYLGLGSNLGDKHNNLDQAINIINNSKYCEVVKVSEYYETKPVGYLEQDDFSNCAVEIKTIFSPKELIKFLLNVEKDLKRERTIKWGPRTIDLDVLLFDNIVTSYEDIIIPHPRMHKRMFVLKPLSDIAPYVMHPILNKRIINLLDNELKSSS